MPQEDRSRLGRLARNPITWWFVALVGFVLTVLGAALVVAGAFGAAITCWIPHACAEGTGLPFFLRVEAVVAAGLTLLVAGAVGYHWARRSEHRATGGRGSTRG